MKKFEPGDRVRLHSGNDYGTVVETGYSHCRVQWDRGAQGVWLYKALCLVPEPPASAATSGMIEDTPMALDAEAWEDS